MRIEPGGKKLRKVLLVFASKPPLLSFLASAFHRRGIATEAVFADTNHWFDRYVIHKTNKIFHNLRILPKGKNVFTDHPLVHKNYRSNNLLKTYLRFQPDLVFLIRGYTFNYDAFERISEKTPLFGWWIEMEGRMEEAFRETRFFDWYFFINSSCVEKAMERGIPRVSLMPHAVDPDAFFPIEGIEKKYDICFIGHWSSKRQEYIEALLRVTGNIVIYGNKWTRKNRANPLLRQCVRGKYVDGDELVKIYNESRIVLNITNWGRDAGSARSGVNMRVLETPAAGAFLLTDDSRDLERLATPGKHVAVYEDREDCIRKAGYYLGNAAEREAIARAGCSHVRSNYTYDDIVDRIMNKYAELSDKNASDRSARRVSPGRG